MVNTRFLNMLQSICNVANALRPDPCPLLVESNLMFIVHGVRQRRGKAETALELSQ